MSYNLTSDEVDDSRISKWLQNWEDLTIKTILIELSQEALHWIEFGADELDYDSSSDTSDVGLNMNLSPAQIRDFLHEKVTSIKLNEDSSDDEVVEPRIHYAISNFRRESEEISAALSQLGMKAWPKLEWTSPVDAGFVIGCTDGCSAWSLDQVWDILRNSDRIGNAAATIRQMKINPILALRKDLKIREAAEFRLFFKETVLVGCSQRHADCFFEFDAQFLTECKERIDKFARDIVPSKLEGSSLKNRVVIDIYLGRPPKNKIWVIDISHWGGATNPLLFEWSDLDTAFQNRDKSSWELRVVKSQVERMPDEKILQKLPLELRALSSYEQQKAELIVNEENE